MNTCWGFRGRPEEESLQQRIEHIQELVRTLHRQILFQTSIVQRHAQEGLRYLESGDEYRARAEAQLQLQAIDTRQVYVDIHTKFRLLLNDVERSQNLSVCMTHFQMAAGIMGNVQLKIQDVDEQMVKLEMQVEKSRDVSKSLVKPIDNVRKVLETPFELPNVPIRVKEKEQMPRMEMEL